MLRCDPANPMAPPAPLAAPAPPGAGLRRAWGAADGARRLPGRATAPSIRLKSPAEVDRMRAAGRVVHRALDAAAAACRPGVTTADVDAVARSVIEAAGGASVLRGFDGGEGRRFPGDTCISVNEQVVHGVPGPRRIEPGDIVTIDCGVRLAGWCSDAARTVCVGEVSPDAAQLVQTAELALATAVNLIRPGLRWSQVAAAMQAFGHDSGYGVITGYVGHGIGRRLHEPPQTPAFLTAGFVRHQDFVLAAGMTLAIEPILALGAARTRTLDDGWTVITEDGQPACHVEHTIAVTRHGADILTNGR